MRTTLRVDLSDHLALGAAGLAAGAVNSIAGGGTLLSFPAAMAAGLPAICANATNAVGLSPGSFVAAWGFQTEVRRHARLTLLLLGPGLAGGLTGSIILRHTPQRTFDVLVPWLVLAATLLLLVHHLRGPREHARETVSRSRFGVTMVVAGQFLVGVYGGYFGAAMGIVMLAMYSFLPELDIQAANGIKNVLGGAINCIASVYFLASGIVDYGAAAVLMVGASVGGLLGARWARRVSAKTVRWLVIVIGLTLSALLAYRSYGRPS